MKMPAGLTSITFRTLSPQSIVQLCVEAGLETIEWGGDVHVPHGDVETAYRVRALTEEAGLTVSSYGSYYRAGRTDGEENPDPQAVVDTAVALHAPIIRIWAGDRASAKISTKRFDAVVRDCRVICELAAQQGLLVAAECHPHTLTDDYESTMRLLNAVAHPSFKLYWQPNQNKDIDYDMHAIHALQEHIVMVHTFFWSRNGRRMPLEKGWAQWLTYCDAVGIAPRAFLLEFMPHDDPAELMREAETLKHVLSMAIY